MTDTAIRIVRDFCAAWDRMDWDAVTSALSDDIF
jgi:limonene-1,2-epoxide hydrolase